MRIGALGRYCTSMFRVAYWTRRKPVKSPTFFASTIRRVVAGLALMFLFGAFATTYAYANPSLANLSLPRGYTQKSFIGKPICGTYDFAHNRMAPPCGVARAKYVSKARGTCPRGSFFDIGTWSCYTCPRGYNRTANAVDTPAACSKAVRRQLSRAVAVGKHKACPRGSFLDPRNGGECWRCPSGYGRTAAPVDAWNACGMVFKRATKATFVSRVCPSGSITDPNGSCYVCPKGFNRTASAVTARDACVRTEDLKPAKKTAALTCKAGEIFDFINGGTCWACPSGSVRSMSSIKAKDACVYTTYRWDTAKRDPKGLFELPGASEVAARLVVDGKLINQVITKTAQVSKRQLYTVRKNALGLINRAPGDSPILKAAVYAKIIDLIKHGAKTGPENSLLKYVARYVQESRLLSAQEMKNIWESLKAAHAERGKSRTALLSTAFDLGPKPPQMSQLAGQVMVLSAGGVATASVATLAAVGGTTMWTSASLFVGKSAINAVMPYVAFEGSEIAAAGAAGIAGPASVIAGAAIVAGMSIDILVKQDQMESTISAALARARRPVNLAKLISTKNGRTELLNNWSLMTEKPSRPNSAYANLLKQNATKSKTASDGTVKVDSNVMLGHFAVEGGPGTAWNRLAGAARDVAVSSNGILWHISLKNVSPAGGAMYYMDPKTRRWQRIRGQATRLAFFGTQPWCMNADGNMYRLVRGAWQAVMGPKAVDIGGSSKALWMLGGKRLKGGHEIFRFTGNGWQKVPGAAWRIAVAGTQPWLVNDQGYVYRRDGNRWTRVRNAPVGYDIAADAKSVWLLGGKMGKGGYQTFHLDGQKWQQIPGEAIAIDMDPHGMPVVANKGGAIFVRR